MDIKLWEFRKIIFSPVIVLTVILFLIFNVFIISNNRYIKDELLILNKLVDKFGNKIDEDMIKELDKFYNLKLKEFNKITYEKAEKTYKSVMEFEEDFNLNYTDKKKELFLEKDIEFINQVMVVENYNYAIKNMDKAYESVDVMKQAEGEIKMYSLTGEVAETVRKQYKKIEKRLNELMKDDEHKNLFFDGSIYKRHTFLFKTIFGWIILEITTLVVLITGYLNSYEFENNTKDIVYSTRRGRKLAFDKLWTSMACSVLVTTILVGATLLVYFNTFSYKGLFDVSINNYFNWENSFPYIAWWKMSFVKYLFSCIFLVYIFELFFTIITFIISTLIKNSYITFFVFAILFGIVVLSPLIIHLDNNIIFLAYMTPYHLVLNPFLWFMGRGAFTAFEYYEITTVILWTILLLIAVKLCIKIFERQNI